MDKTKTTKIEESFLFFGCWNNINCDNKYIHRDIVLDYIIKNEKKCDTLYIAGDNWYNIKVPNHNNKISTKYYLLQVLKSGYDKIYKMNKNVHIAVGNHDEDDDGEQLDLKKRCMIKTQFKYIKNLNEKRENSVDSPASFMSSPDSSSSPPDDSSSLKTSDRKSASTSSIGVKKSKDCIESLEEVSEQYFVSLEDLLGINELDITPEKNDKNMYLYVDKIGTVYYESYIMIIINTNNLNNKEYMKNIEDYFDNINHIKNQRTVFVMGHVPIFCFKDNELKEVDENMITIFELLSKYKYIYICADSHYFNIMNIRQGEKSVLQITVGTGGADPDINDEYIDNIKTYNAYIEYNNYILSYYHINSYGYALFKLNSNKELYLSYKNIIKKEFIPHLIQN